MQTHLADFVKQSPDHEELNSILRACVHCGCCNATCPTYQILGDELDGPRGRIYLLKQMFEGHAVTGLTQQHLDRCLTCRACETTCPSGVRYGRLLDLGRVMVDAKVIRPWSERLIRKAILSIFPYRKRFAWLLTSINLIRPFLSSALQKKLPQRVHTENWPTLTQQRKMLILPGCVQNVLAPNIDLATARVLAKLRIELLQVNEIGCCGAMHYHLSDHERALALARNNIDACWPFIQDGAEAIVSTASGCGVQLKDYGLLLKHDPEYSEKAVKFSELTKDIAEILNQENFSIKTQTKQRVVFQAPCTLQHGQKITGIVETILQKTGAELLATPDSHLCCGSAGVYSLLQPKLSNQLRVNKIKALTTLNPNLILTANIGCLSHLQATSSTKVMHWIEFLDVRSRVSTD